MKRIIALVIIAIVVSSCSDGLMESDKKIGSSLEYLGSLFSSKKAEDIDFESVFANILDNEKGIGVTNFNMCLNSEGYIESFNISLSNERFEHEITYLYRREDQTSKCYMLTDKDAQYYNNENLEVLNMVNDIVQSQDLQIAEDELLNIELICPTDIEVDLNAGDIVDGLVINAPEKITGLEIDVYNSNILNSTNDFIYVKKQK